MESKEVDRSSSGLSQTLGAGDAKPAQPPTSVKNEVRWEMLAAVHIIVEISVTLVMQSFLL